MFAARKILRSDASGPPTGSILMARDISRDVNKSISRDMAMSLKLFNLSDKKQSERFDIGKIGLKPGNRIITDTISERTIAGYSYIDDINKKPVIGIKILKKRNVYLQGRDSIFYLFVSSLAVGSMFMIVSLFFIQGILLRPLSKTILEIIAVGQKKEFTGRLALGNTEELKKLAESVNNLLDAQDAAREELRISEERYKAIVEMQTERVCRYSIEGICTYANPAFAELHGKKPEDLIGANFIPEIIPEDMKEVIESMVTLSDKKRSVNIEYRVRDKDGVIHWMRSTGAIILDDSDRPVEFQIVARDITERKEMELSLAKSRKYSSIAQLSMGLSHEIKNPLSIIQAHVETLQDNEEIKFAEDTNVAYSLDVISKQADRISYVMSNLSSLARESDFKPAPLNIVPQIDMLTEMLKPSLKKNGVSVEKKYSLDSNAVVNGDTGRLFQIFTNLMLNARDNMPDGGMITVEIIPDNGFVTVTITDTGQGISPDNLRKVFEPFFSTNPKGMGMGLPLCKRDVEEHGGTIEISSAEGLWTKVTVRLPAAKQ